VTCLLRFRLSRLFLSLGVGQHAAHTCAATELVPLSSAGLQIVLCSPSRVQFAFWALRLACMQGDTFVKIHHSEKLCEAYAGDKNLIRCARFHHIRPWLLLGLCCLSVLQ
jgi:hypothetical protein